MKYSSQKGRFFWGRKRVTEKIYYNKLRQQSVGKNIKTNYEAKRSLSVSNLPSNNSNNFIETTEAVITTRSTANSKCLNELDGRRIVNIKFLADQLYCNYCRATIKLSDIIGEQKFGMASCFFMKCKACVKTSSVFTDKQHFTEDGKKHFDINTSMVLCK